MRTVASATALVLLLAHQVLGQEVAYSVPDGPELIIEALSPFRGDPDSARVVRLLAELAAESRFPVSGHDHVLSARLWRRAGEADLAIATLEAISSGSGAWDLAMYETARIQFDAGRVESGARAYWSACESTNVQVREEIAWDLLPVATTAEREAWAELPPGDSTCVWLRDFWNERAVRAALGRDERLGIHFHRMADAHRRFRLARPRYLKGMSDVYGRPDGLAVDDRGLLWIRLGPPDEDLACPEQVPPSRAQVGFVNLLGRCWVYWQPTGYRIFYLSTRDRFEDDAPDGDFRIQESLSQQAEPGTDFFQRYVMNADIPTSVKRRLVERGPAFRNARLAEAGVRVSVSDSLAGDLDGAEYLALQHELRDVTRAFADAALQRIPDVPDVESTLAMRFEVLRFLNPSSSLWQVWLLASVRAGDLIVDEVRGSLDVGGRIATMEGAEADVRLVDLPERSVSADLPAEAGIEVRGAITASSGAWPVTLVVEDLNAPGTGAWIQDTIQVPAIGGLPQLSDIAIAQAEGGTWTRDGQTFLQVSPAHVTNLDGSIHTYFEVYGVRPGTRYDVELRLAPVDVAERIWRLEPDDLGFRLQFTSEMPGEIGRHHLRLDLSDTEPGEYVLAVRIQDDDTKAYSLPSVTGVFVARP